MKLGLVSLGCPKNLVDSEVMLGIIDACQIEIVNDPAEAEIIIVNTCGFIESAKQESIDTILSMAEYKETGKCRYLVVTGCLAQRYAEDLFRDMPEVDAIVGTNVYRDIALVLEKVLAGQRLIHMTAADWEANQKASAAGEAQAGREGDTALSLPPNKTEPVAAGIEEQRRTALADPRFLTTAPYTAYLKIAEGCDNFCSFCAIPLIRGRYISKPYEQILAEARSLAAQGVKELVVVAQDTTRYGEDIYGESRLPELIDAVCEIEGVHWVRILYCYPDRVTDKLIDTIARQPKAVHYFDIPVQHASAHVLRDMNRRGDRRSITALCQKIREKIPDVVLRTTLIAGFPTESEEDFAELCKLVEEVRFDRLGCFAYSQEEDTPAAELEQIPEEVRRRRAEIIMELQMSAAFDFADRCTGRTLEVLAEGWEDGQYYGRSYMDAPDIDTRVYFTSEDEIEPGSYVPVLITDTDGYDLIGMAKAKEDTK